MQKTVGRYLFKSVNKRTQKYTMNIYELYINYILHYINTNEIPGELSRFTYENNMSSSHVKRSRLLWLHDTSRLSQQKKCFEVKWFGISLVFIE